MTVEIPSVRLFRTVRFLLFLVWAGFVTPLQAQQRVLSLEDAVLAYRKGLTPKRLPGFVWPENATSYVTMNAARDTLTVHPLRTNFATVELRPDDVLPGLDRFPLLHWVSGSVFWFTQGDSLLEFNLESRRLAKVLEYPSEKAQNLTYHFRSKRLAYTIDHNLYLADKDHRQIPIAHSDNPDIVTGQAIARFEFGIQKGIFWSPRGRYLAFYRKDESNVPDYPLVDISTTPAHVKMIKYPMNGGGSEIPAVGIYFPDRDKVVFLKTKKDDHYITNLAWDQSGQYVYIAEVNRDQNHMWLNQYDPYTGELIKTLFEETNPKWVEPEHPAFTTHFLPQRLIWLSERDGFMNLYAYEFPTNKLRQITHNKWVAKEIVGYSRVLGMVIFTGTGDNALNTHAFAVNVKTGKQIQLTKGDGVHRVKLVGTNDEFLIDEYTSRTVPYRLSYLNLRTNEWHTIYTAPNPLAGVKIGDIDVFTIKSYDGTDLYARLIKASDFDPHKRYPVLVYVYNGPHVQLITNRWRTGAPLWMHWLAEQDYLVFTIDGHGSDNRGFDFESEIFRRLGFHEMQDQLIGVDWLKRQPFVDTTRLAVHGWSYGGFMTTSLMLRHPGVFTTGVAGGPVIDWKWYEVMYGERYMDTPQTNPEGFKENSLLNYVTNLKGHLLTIHGTVDDVVVPQHNYAFIKKCVDEGVQTDFYPYPMHPHNVRGKDRVHLMTKVLNYIMEHNR